MIQWAGLYSVCRLGPAEPAPKWALAQPFSSVTRTADELSIVCRADDVEGEIQSETGFRLLQVEGPIPFTATGVVSTLAGILAGAGISVLAIATFDTDYLLVKDSDLAAALVALRKQGHSIRQQSKSDRQ